MHLRTRPLVSGTSAYLRPAVPGADQAPPGVADATVHPAEKSAELARQIRHSALAHGSDRYALWQALQPLIEQLPDLSAQDWAGLGQFCQTRTYSARGTLLPALLPPLLGRFTQLMSTPYTSETLPLLLALVDAWEPVAHHDPSLRATLDQALRLPVLPSGKGLRQALTQRTVDNMVDIWPLVLKQFFLLGWTLRITGADIQAACDMSRLNRWFHRHVGPLIPQAVLHALRRPNVLGGSSDMGSPEPWTRLPLSSFLLWTKNSALSEEERLLRLLRTLLNDFNKQSKVFHVLKELWGVYFTPSGPLKAACGCWPRLVAEALMTGSGQFHGRTHGRVFRWLEIKLHPVDPAHADPAWVELGVGAALRTRLLDHVPFESQGVNELRRFEEILAVSESRLWRRLPAVREGLTGVAALLIYRHHIRRQGKKAPPAKPTEQELSAALGFIDAFSALYPLQGSLRSAKNILQAPAYRIVLNEAQHRLLKSCLKNDAARRAPTALIRV